MVTTYFLGACSPKGFFSHYDSLLREKLSLTVIKGGSGCGKSTFMRAVGKQAEQRGLDVSYILCSSDPSSLDGVVIPELKLAYADGTAPHVLEPKLCGGSMNYLNFGEFYDSGAMAANEAEIFEAQRLNQAQYPHVTACMAAADRLLESVRAETSANAYRQEVEAIAECLALSLLKPTDASGAQCKRFLTAVTPEGLHFCRETPEALCGRVYVLRDNYQQAPRLLELLSQKAEQMGIGGTVCYSPMLPDERPSHLLLPEAQVAIVSESADFPWQSECCCRIDLDSTLPPRLRGELSFVTDTVTSLYRQAVVHMRQAKRLHDRIELLCRPFVDFRAVEEMTRKTLQSIFGG